MKSVEFLEISKINFSKKVPFCVIFRALEASHFCIISLNIFEKGIKSALRENDGKKLIEEIWKNEIYALRERSKLIRFGRILKKSLRSCRNAKMP